jgi:hypothetical protein
VGGLTIEACIEIGKAVMAYGPREWDLKLDGLPKVSAEEWITKVLRHRLHEQVPPDVRALFRGAQAMLAYGCLFYPLATLAMEQLLRVLEAAVTHVCKEHSGPGEKDPFQKKLKWLCEKSVISEDQWHGWDNLRTIRNGTSHPTHQMLMPPAMADHTFALLCEELNQLFKNGNVSA